MHVKTNCSIDLSLPEELECQHELHSRTPSLQTGQYSKRCINMRLDTCLKLTALSLTLGASAQSEPSFSAEGIYAMFTESLRRCEVMYPAMREPLATTGRVLQRYLELDPVLKQASQSSRLPDAKKKVNAELDEIFGKHAATEDRRRDFCESVAKGDLGMLQMPVELYEIERKAK
jgi:hypothetical protein